MANLPLVRPAEDADAPCFNALTEKQKRFVLALLQYGDSNHKKAARIAGYEGDDNTVAVSAHRLFHDPRIQRAVHEVAAAHLASSQIMAISGIIKLAESSTKEEVKLKALLALADRTGFAAVQQINVTKEDVNASRETRLAEMTTMCVKNPKLLESLEPQMRALIEARIEGAGQPVQAVQAIEVEYKEVDPDDAILGL